MARLGLDADQHRLRAALRRLQRRGVLEGVARHDAIVVIGGGDERRRVMRPRLHVVDRRVPIEERELAHTVSGAVFRDPGPADREFVEAQHVHHADRGQGSPKQVGPLVQDGADQQPAVRAAADCQVGR